MKIKIAAQLERVFGWLAEFFEQQRERVALCPNCGGNRYKGKPCMTQVVEGF